MILQQIYLHNIQNKIPFLSFLIACLFFASQTHVQLLLLLPLSLCFICIVVLAFPSLYLPFVLFLNNRVQILNIASMVLALIVIWSVVLLDLHQTSNKTHIQETVQSISIFLMSFVMIMIVVSVSYQNIYIDIARVLLIICSFILSLVCIIINQEKARQPILLSVCSIYSLFVLNYIFHHLMKPTRIIPTQQFSSSLFGAGLKQMPTLPQNMPFSRYRRRT